ncbi:hypothetical protein J6590_012876 [Homalodisca vitripennis]|nr:hypothetical protein J6590_012876 [Homalodisca vitripennis]
MTECRHDVNTRQTAADYTFGMTFYTRQTSLKDLTRRGLLVPYRAPPQVAEWGNASQIWVVLRKLNTRGGPKSARGRNPNIKPNMESAEVNILPQAGTLLGEGNAVADSDQVKAPVVGAGSKDFGRSQLWVMMNQTGVAGVDHLAPTRSFVTSEARDRGELTEYPNQDWRTLEELNEPTAVRDEDRKEFEKNLLLQHSRRKSIGRSPSGKDRTHSLDRQDFSTPSSRKKRKVEESPRDSRAVTRERNLLWHRMVKRVSDLQKLIQDNPKTKTDIKKFSEDLQSLTSVLVRLDEEIKEKEAGKLPPEALTHEIVEKRTVATQTRQSITKAETILSGIKEGMDNTQIKQLNEADWPESVFDNTKICRGGILGKSTDDTRVLYINGEKFSGSQLEKNLIVQVPGLKGNRGSSGGLLIVESRDLVQFEGEAKAAEESRLVSC